MLPQDLVFIDVETTGLSVTRDRIIEVGIVKVRDNKIIEEYQTLVNPNMYISPLISQITGITKEDLEKAPSFADISDRVRALCKDAFFVAHNVRFDYGFMKNEFARLDYIFSAKHFCTAKLSRVLFPERKHHNLDSIIEQFGFVCEKRHRAFDDAKVLWEFYCKLQKVFPLDFLETAIHQVMRKPSIPQQLETNQIDNLPQSPGVYIFYGENNMPLYVGKSKNVKERVLSHFASDYTRSTEMHLAQQVRNITAIATGGELSALIKESYFIKTLQPLYNRKSRLQRKLTMLSSVENSDGYLEVSLRDVEKIYSQDLATLIGIFSSKKRAKEYLMKIQKEYALCDKLLGLEKTTQACFSARLGICKGACIKDETALRYNMRFIQATSRNKVKPWPFKGPIAITEVFDEIYEKIVVDQWCIIDTEVKEYFFDMDTYKILVQYLRNTKNYASIHALDSQNELV